MGLNIEERRAVVSYRLEKAERTLEQARYNLSSGFWELIANRMYYAAYYAVSALLIADGYSAKTHETIVRFYGMYYIKTGIMATEYGRLYNKLFTLRLTGDYNDHYNLEESDVLPLFEPTERMIKEISALTKDILNKLDFQEEKTPAV